MRTIEARPIDPTAFGAFGSVIDAEGKTGEPINDGTTLRFADLASLDIRASHLDPVLGIYVARARPFPLRIARLERHRQAAQVFLPLGPQRFIVVVAPGAQSPDWSALQAFVTASGQGVVLNRGCWHHGLVALEEGDRFAVIEGGNYRDDAIEAEAPEAIELTRP